MFGLNARAFPVFVASCLLTAALAPAQQTINVDFNGAESSGTYSGTGPSPDTGTLWNPVAGTGAPLTSGPLQDSQGNATAVTVSINTYNVYDADENPAAFAPALLNDFIWQINNVDPNSPPGNFSISGLNPALTYDLYVLGQNGGYENTTTTFTVGGNTLLTTNDDSAGSPGAFILGRNYNIFTGLTPDGSGTISGTFNVAEPGNNAAFNGFQLVAIPEPAALSLLAAGGLLARGRRRTR